MTEHTIFNNTTPFGLLSEDMQEELKVYSGKIELYSLRGWVDKKYPDFYSAGTYRAVKEPVVEEFIRYGYSITDLYVTENIDCNYKMTYNTVGGVVDLTSIVIERLK